jgi:hypothetical protein
MALGKTISIIKSNNSIYTLRNSFIEQIIQKVIMII